MSRRFDDVSRPRPSRPFIGPIFAYIVTLSICAGLAAWIVR